MTSLIDQNFGETVPNFVEQHGETVTRYRDRRAGDAQAVTAVAWIPEEELVNDDRGRGYVTRGELMLQEAQEVTRKDSWVVRGARFEVERINQPEGGVRSIILVRRVSDSTTSVTRTPQGRV